MSETLLKTPLHAQRVLHWHVVAGERHHAGAEFEVQRVQRGLQQLFGGHISSWKKCGSEASASAFDDVDRQTAAGGLLVFAFHVGAGLAHCAKCWAVPCSK